VKLKEAAVLFVEDEWFMRESMAPGWLGTQDELSALWMARKL
jgi:hypothetical protein